MKKTKAAYNRGYRATKDGKVIGTRGKPLSFRIDTRGYFSFNLKLGGRSIPINVHRLVAFQKFGESLFKDGIQVRHLDNDKQNNSWDNIAIGSGRENKMDMPPNMRRQLALNAGRANSPLNEQDVQDIRGKFASGATYHEIMGEYGIAKSTTFYIKNHITWKNI